MLYIDIVFLYFAALIPHPQWCESFFIKRKLDIVNITFYDVLWSYIRNIHPDQYMAPVVKNQMKKIVNSIFVMITGKSLKSLIL